MSPGFFVYVTAWGIGILACFLIFAGRLTYHRILEDHYESSEDRAPRRIIYDSSGGVIIYHQSRSIHDHDWVPVDSIVTKKTLRWICATCPAETADETDPRAPEMSRSELGSTLATLNEHRRKRGLPPTPPPPVRTSEDRFDRWKEAARQEHQQRDEIVAQLAQMRESNRSVETILRDLNEKRSDS